MVEEATRKGERRKRAEEVEVETAAAANEREKKTRANEIIMALSCTQSALVSRPCFAIL